MGLLDGFEKLINEHGSAVILKERIALANDKYAILEKEASVLKSENERLKLITKSVKSNGGHSKKSSLIFLSLKNTLKNPALFLSGGQMVNGTSRRIARPVKPQWFHPVDLSYMCAERSHAVNAHHSIDFMWTTQSIDCQMSNS